MATSKVQPSTAYLTNADTLLNTTNTGNNIELSNPITNYLLCVVDIIDSSGNCLNSIVIPTERINNGIGAVYPSYYSDSQIVRYITFASATKVGISSGGGENIRVMIYGLFKRRS